MYTVVGVDAADRLGRNSAVVKRERAKKKRKRAKKPRAVVSANKSGSSTATNLDGIALGLSRSHGINRGTGYVDQDPYYVNTWIQEGEAGTSPWGDRLIAGPYVGEFGWELFGWQGRLRRLSQHFQKTIVICRKGLSCLYQDFADEIQEYTGDLSGETSGPLLQNFKYRNEIVYDQKKDLRILPQTALVNYNWRRATQKKSDAFDSQSFVQYGKPKGAGWDILFHARNTEKSSSGYRNWGEEPWSKLLEALPPLRTASVGTKDSADHVPGSDDLRGIALSKLADTMCSSGLIVGPSSGPIHLAALCGCPQLTWFGLPWGEANVRRYRDWNPFHVLNVAIYDVEWNPDPNQVAFEAMTILKKTRLLGGKANGVSVG